MCGQRAAVRPWIDPLAAADKPLANGDDPRLVGQPADPDAVGLGLHDIDLVKAHDVVIADSLEAEGSALVEREKCRRHEMGLRLAGFDTDLRAHARAYRGVGVFDLDFEEECSGLGVGVRADKGDGAGPRLAGYNVTLAASPVTIRETDCWATR